jgi:hypothetical protein
MELNCLDSIHLRCCVAGLHSGHSVSVEFALALTHDQLVDIANPHL